MSLSSMSLPQKTIRFCIVIAFAMCAMPLQATLVVDFEFNEPAGSKLIGGVTSSVGGYQWSSTSANFDNVVTDGSGTLDIVYNSTSLTSASIELAASDQITSTQNSLARFSVEFAPWNFGPFDGTQEQLRFGLGNTSATNVFAQFRFTRSAADQITVVANAAGTGGVSGTDAVLPFGDVQTEIVTMILDIDEIADTYGLSYQVGAGPVVPVAGNTGLALGSDRDGKFLRFAIDENFTGDTFGVNRITLEAIPEPASFVLLGLVTGLSMLHTRFLGKV